MSLQRPIRPFVDPEHSTARRLVQKFVHVGAERETEREREKERLALLVPLCKRTYKQGVIVFSRSKWMAYLMRVVFGTLSMQTGGMQGNLSQDR